MTKDKWYTRPVLFVGDVTVSLEFFETKLGFARAWEHEERRVIIVAQVNRGDCEIILCHDKARAGQGRLFVSLESEEAKRWQQEIDDKALGVENGWWGMSVEVLRDPDGNELYISRDGD